jgi:outer membrane protein assembly factor BamD
MTTSHRLRTLVVPLSFLLILGLATACRKKTVEVVPDLASSDEALYKLGESGLKKDTEKSLLYLRQVIDSFPKSFYAQRAKLLIADAYFAKGDETNLIMAAAEYREFIRTYPYSPSAAYAQYQIAMTFYKKKLKIGRDPSKTIQALAEFKKVVTDFPASDQAKAAQDNIKECEERLAAHNADIAISYCNRRAYRASISRLTEIMTTYPEYSRLYDIYHYLGECHFQMRQYDQALPFFTKVVTDYPQQKLAKSATKRLAEIEKLKSAPPKAAKPPKAKGKTKAIKG